jgi:hypothetical protein
VSVLLTDHAVKPSGLRDVFQTVLAQILESQMCGTLDLVENLLADGD